jgi:hypothetical protein
MPFIATTFGPLVADVSQWFPRRPAIAVAIVASGNDVAAARPARGRAMQRRDQPRPSPDIDDPTYTNRWVAPSHG